jgi:hypothetical protein
MSSSSSSSVSDRSGIDINHTIIVLIHNITIRNNKLTNINTTNNSTTNPTLNPATTTFNKGVVRESGRRAVVGCGGNSAMGEYT